MPLPPTASPNGPKISPHLSTFMIGKNRDGLWVAREETGCVGEIFLTERAATRFAERWARILDCTTIRVSKPLELEFDHRMNAILSLCIAARRGLAHLRDAPAFDLLRIVFGLAALAIAVWLVLALLTFGR